MFACLQRTDLFISRSPQTGIFCDTLPQISTCCHCLETNGLPGPIFKSRLPARQKSSHFASYKVHLLYLQVTRAKHQTVTTTRQRTRPTTSAGRFFVRFRHFLEHGSNSFTTSTFSLPSFRENELNGKNHAVNFVACQVGVASIVSIRSSVQFKDFISLSAPKYSSIFMPDWLGRMWR